MLKEKISSFYETILKNGMFWGIVFLFAVLSYGFNIFNRTIHVDDLVLPQYLGDGYDYMVRQMRWGWWLYHKFLGENMYSPFIFQFCAVIFLVAAGTACTCIFYCMNDRIKPYQAAIICSMMVTYPLVNEFWEYFFCQVAVGNIFLAAVAVLVMMLVENRKLAWVLSSAILSIVASSYESGLFVYTTLVLIVLFCEYCINEKKDNWIKEGLTYAGPLLIGVGLRFLIGWCFLLVLRLDYLQFSDVSIHWRLEGLGGQIKDLVWKLLSSYVRKGLVYFPIAILCLFIAVFCIYFITLASKKKKFLPVLIGGSVVVSLFLLSIVQGTVMPYRTAQGFIVFMGFVTFLLICETNFKPVVKTIMTGVLIWVCWRQGVYANEISALNNQRSDNEAVLISQVGYDLMTEYPDKPVAFVGNYDMGGGTFQGMRIMIAEARLCRQTCALSLTG